MSRAESRTTRVVARAAALLLFAVTLVALAPTTANASAAQLYSLLNRERVAKGLPALVRDPAMDEVAQKWTRHLASTGQLGHNPKYAQQIPAGWRVAGENVGYAPAADRLHRAWMDSPGHRDNIMASDYTSVGIGYVVEDGRVWGTQVFARYPGVKPPSSTPFRPAEPKPAPRPVTTRDTAAKLNDLTGDRVADLLARDRAGRLWIYRGDGRGRVASKVGLGSGWDAMSLITSAGDLTGDGRGDVLARDRSGRLWLYPGAHRTGLGARVNLGGGWNSIRALVAPGDFTGDGRADLLARDSGGRLWLYPGDGRGSFTGRSLVGSGWGTLGVVGAGDLSGDKTNDLLARDPSGRLWLYPGDGRGRVLARTLIGTGWSGMRSLAVPGDLTSDGVPDLLATDSSGRQWRYSGTGRSKLASRVQVGHGWQTLDSIS